MKDGTALLWTLLLIVAVFLGLNMLATGIEIKNLKTRVADLEMRTAIQSNTDAEMQAWRDKQIEIKAELYGKPGACGEPRLYWKEYSPGHSVLFVSNREVEDAVCLSILQK